ncbi:rplE [Symbiodinium necroappetens]|uniref:RplE protein n=1 Tax=Symbiodinium necroappetens TaxID=1628268 RepID=A0A812YYI0_9DINO|nr:rplE [Symbiodinium necroappetens]
MQPAAAAQKASMRNHRAGAGIALAGLGLLVYNLAGPRLFVAPQPEMLGIPRHGSEARGEALIMCAAKPGGRPVDVTQEAMPASTIKVKTGKGELTVDQQFDKKERTTRWLKTLKGKFVYRGPKPADPDQFIKVNIAVPLAPKQASNTKIMNQVIEELRRVSGVHPVATYFTANNAELGYRVGDKSGAKVNIRGHLMHDFLQRLNTIVLPRVRDFEGLDPTSFNRKANYWMHLPSQEPFNELDELLDSREVVHGFNIRILNNCFTQPDALKLMKEFGFPFGEGAKGSLREVQEQGQGQEEAIGRQCFSQIAMWQSLAEICIRFEDKMFAPCGDEAHEDFQAPEAAGALHASLLSGISPAGAAIFALCQFIVTAFPRASPSLVTHQLYKYNRLVWLYRGSSAFGLSQAVQRSLTVARPSQSEDAAEPAEELRQQRSAERWGPMTSDAVCYEGY